MDVADTTEEAAQGAAAPDSRQRWRIAALACAVIVVGLVAGFRVVEREERPVAGDRHEVAYEGDDGCGFVNVRVGGLWLRGMSDLSRPPVAPGDGTLVIGQVRDHPVKGGGLSVSGVLTLADGTKLEMSGGRVSEGIFTYGCAIRN